jgi:hypothetical protein
MTEQPAAEPKSSWPDLVGQDADTATAVIKADAPDVTIQVGVGTAACSVAPAAILRMTPGSLLLPALAAATAPVLNPAWLSPLCFTTQALHNHHFVSSMQVLPAGSFATMDWVESRVRLWLDDAGKVNQVPIRG